MSLVRPIALSMDAFDAKKNQTFYFSVNGGDQVVRNKLTIRDNETNVIVYEVTKSTYNFEHMVGANTLENGRYYNFYFNTYNTQGDVSVNSNVIQFYCYSTPTLELTNIPIDGIIKNNYYTFQATYRQLEGQYVNELRFYLYDEFENIVAYSEPYQDKTGSSVFMVSHTFNGFENNRKYKINVIAKSVDGMVTESGYNDFVAKYVVPKTYSLIELENDCEDGCVRLKSNIVVIDGETKNIPVYVPIISSTNVVWNKTYSNPTWDSYVRDYGIKWEVPYSGTDVISKWARIEINHNNSKWNTSDKDKLFSKWNNFMFDSRDNGQYVRWYKGFSIPSDFTFTVKVRGSYLGRIFLMGTLQNGFSISLKKEVPYNENKLKFYFELVGYKNGQQVVTRRSEYYDYINNKTSYFVWFRKIDNEYDFRIEINSNEETQFSWGKSKNVYYGKRLNNIYWNDKIERADEYNDITNDLSSIFPLNNLQLENGMFYDMDLTSNIDYEYSQLKRDWDYYTIINCDFQGTIRGGLDINVQLSTLESIKIKRRNKGTFDWITLKEFKITEDAFNIDYNDYYVPSGYEADYAVVPVSQGNIEGDYIINSIKTSFNNVTFIDRNQYFNLKAEILLDIDKNITVSQYQPLNSIYPIIVKNNVADYYSGTITATLLGYNFNKNKIFDRYDIKKQTEDFCKFLSNMKAKIIKDWNGNIFLVRFNGNPKITYRENTGNAIVSVGCEWVEQGKFDNQTDMYNNGLIDVAV